MYSTKNIEKILLASLCRNKKVIYAEAMYEDTDDNYLRNQYTYIDNIENIKQTINKPEFSQAVEAYKNGHRIYRGVLRQENHLSAYTVPGMRKSQNLVNIYTPLFSHYLPSWKNFPPRDECAVCSNNINYASNYAQQNPFIIFPVNNTKIGVCSQYDIWFSFPVLKEKYNIKTLKDFSEYIYDFIIDMFEKAESDDAATVEWALSDGELSTVLNDTSYFTKEYFREQIEIFKKDNDNEFGEDLSDYTEKDLLDWQISTYIENTFGVDYGKTKRFFIDLITNIINGEIYKWLDGVLNPKDNGFILTDISNVPIHTNNNVKSGKELWFSAPYLMIRNDIMKEIESDWE